MENKTAIDWLIEELGEYFPNGIAGIHLMVAQAKLMEKEQIKDAFYKGENTIIMDAEEYYNETYLK